MTYYKKYILENCIGAWTIKAAQKLPASDRVEFLRKYGVDTASTGYHLSGLFYFTGKGTLCNILIPKTGAHSDSIVRPVRLALSASNTTSSTSVVSGGYPAGTCLE